MEGLANHCILDLCVVFLCSALHAHVIFSHVGGPPLAPLCEVLVVDDATLELRKDFW